MVSEHSVLLSFMLLSFMLDSCGWGGLCAIRIEQNRRCVHVYLSV